MEGNHLTVELRTITGKESVRKLRASGKVPGVCYGAGAEPISIAFEEKALQKSLDSKRGRNTLLKLHMNVGQGQNLEIPVLIKDVQQNMLKNGVAHVDFIRVDMNKPIRVTVPIVISGKAEGTKLGGALHQEYRSLPLFCIPDKIPAHITIDVTSLGIGQAIHIADLKLPEGITAGLPPETTLCVVGMLREEKVETQPGLGTETPTADGKKAASDGKDDKAKASSAKPGSKEK